MRLLNTNDLSSFMDELKTWSLKHGFLKFAEKIERAERVSFTASDLILNYAETLEALRDRIPETLPQSFRDNWEPAIQVGREAIQTVNYEQKERPILSLGETKPWQG